MSNKKKPKKEENLIESTERQKMQSWANILYFIFIFLASLRAISGYWWESKYFYSFKAIKHTLRMNKTIKKKTFQDIWFIDCPAMAIQAERINFWVDIYYFVLRFVLSLHTFHLFVCFVSWMAFRCLNWARTWKYNRNWYIIWKHIFTGFIWLYKDILKPLIIVLFIYHNPYPSFFL